MNDREGRNAALSAVSHGFHDRSFLLEKRTIVEIWRQAACCAAGRSTQRTSSSAAARYLRYSARRLRYAVRRSADTAHPKGNDRWRRSRSVVERPNLECSTGRSLRRSAHKRGTTKSDRSSSMLTGHLVGMDFLYQCITKLIIAKLNNLI